jgi:hypothetical protein
MAANELIQYLDGKKAQGFTAHPFYSKEGDFLTYYFEDADFYAERIDGTLTAYMSMDTKKPVGFKLKGVRHLLDTLGDFSLEVEGDDGEVRLGMLFLVGMSLIDNPPVLEYYQQFARETKSVRLRKDDLEMACA